MLKGLGNHLYHPNSPLNTTHFHLPYRQFLIHLTLVQIPVFCWLEQQECIHLHCYFRDLDWYFRFQNSVVSGKLFKHWNFHWPQSLPVLTQVPLFLLVMFSSASVYFTHFLSTPQSLLASSHSPLVHASYHNKQKYVQNTIFLSTEVSIIIKKTVVAHKSEHF